MGLLLIIFYFSFVGSACNFSQSGGGGSSQSPTSELLVFTKTEGFRHASIPDGIDAIRRMDDSEKALSVTFTENADEFNGQNLQSYGAVLFLNTTGDILNEAQQQALKNFIQNGGGFMGVHSATDTEYGWPWYGRMIGAYFKNHPPVQQATLYVLTKSHPSTEFLPGEWVRTDEWYNFRDIQDHINPLISLDESTYEGGENGENHPIAWYHEFEGGRVFYTGGGHTSESYSDPDFTGHLLGGIKYVLDN